MARGRRHGNPEFRTEVCKQLTQGIRNWLERQRRDQTGKGIEEVATLLGVSRQTIYNYFREIRTPKHEVIVKAERELGITIHYRGHPVVPDREKVPRVRQPIYVQRSLNFESGPIKEMSVVLEERDGLELRLSIKVDN
jgi:transcriptional regulator with XRE-family HTH domain